MHAQQKLQNSPQNQALTRINEAFVRSFEPVVTSCALSMDAEFGLQLSKEQRDRPEKNNYMKLLEYIRGIRHELSQNYLNELRAMAQAGMSAGSTQVDFTAISLVEDGRVEEECAINTVIRNSENFADEGLLAFNRALNSYWVGHGLVPLPSIWTPEKLVRLLVHVLSAYKLNSVSRVALYKCFENHAFSQLRQIYLELAKYLETDGAGMAFVSTPANPLSSAVAVETAAATVGYLAELRPALERWRKADSNSRYAVLATSEAGVYEGFELEHALEVLKTLRVQNQQTAGNREVPLKQAIVEQLARLDYGGEARGLSPDHEDILDIVALVFDGLVSDNSLPSALKPALLGLEIPVAAIALVHPALLLDPSGAVANVVNLVVSASRFLNPLIAEDQQQIKQIGGQLGQLALNSLPEAAYWQAQYHELRRFMNDLEASATALEQATLDVVLGQDKQAVAVRAIAECIQKNPQATQLPPLITTFLQTVWVQVLRLDFEQKYQAPQQWRQSLQAVDDLIASVLPPADDHEKKRILKILPSLVQELRNGLKRIAYDKKLQARFFKELAVLHVILLDKKIGATLENSAELSGHTEEQSLGDTSFVEALSEPVWLVFKTESGLFWGKFIWQSFETQTALLVAKSGAKLLQLPAQVLNQKLIQGEASIVMDDARPFIERVLTVINSNE